MIDIVPFDDKFLAKAIEWHRNPKLAERIGFTEEMPSENTFEYFSTIANIPGNIFFGIKKNDKEIGYLLISNLHPVNRSAELHICIGEFQGAGYVYVAVRHMLEYLFKHLKLNRVYTTILGDNESLLRMMKKTPFKQEGELREAYRKNGGYVSLVIHSILAKEFNDYIKKEEEHATSSSSSVSDS